MSELYRKYKINFNLNKEHEIAYIPGEFYNLHLEQSKAAIHIYHYLCLRANKNADLGFVRNVSTHKISKDLGMPLRTVQHALNQLLKSTLVIKHCLNIDRSLDLYVNGFIEMFGVNMNYIKLPGYIFTDEFLSYDKAEMSCSLYTYYSTYKNSMASLQRIKATDILNKENWELIDYAKTSREFNEKTLLKAIKRVSLKDLYRVIHKINENGFIEIVDLSEGFFKNSTRKFVVRATQAIKSVFKPLSENQSFIDTYKMSFSQMYHYIKTYAIESYFSTKNDLESLTKIFVHYGEALFVNGMLSFANRINLAGDPLDQNGDFIQNPIGYIVASINNFISGNKQPDFQLC